MAERGRVSGQRRQRRGSVSVDRIAVSARPEPQAPQLDSLIHERTRLGIVSALAAGERLSFTQLRSILKATDGNVSAHARKLEEAGYIVAYKRFEGRIPRTEYELTDTGREALARYVDHMEALLRSLRQRRGGADE